MAEWVLVYWYWWVLALVCLVLEIFTPGFFFMWLAASGIVTGVITLLIPILSTNTQIFIFSLFAVVAIALWHFYGKNLPIMDTDQPLLNKRGAQYIGHVFPLYEAIVNGQGKIKVDDTFWKVHGEDCPVNTRVKVVAVHGLVLEVKIAKSGYHAD